MATAGSFWKTVLSLQCSFALFALIAQRVYVQINNWILRFFCLTLFVRYGTRFGHRVGHLRHVGILRDFISASFVCRFKAERKLVR